MKALIDKIFRSADKIFHSAQRLQAFWVLSQEEEMAKDALRKEIRLHLKLSIRLYLKSLFRRH